MTLNRNKPPVEFHIAKAYQKRHYFSKKMVYYFQTDFQSQQANVENQISTACRQRHNLQRIRISISIMTLNCKKPPLSFRSRRHTKKERIAKISDFNFQNDLKSQQATIEFQILKAYRKEHNSLQNMTIKFPE